MPIILNVVLGVPQMLSNIQMILICVAVSSTAHSLNERSLTPHITMQTDVLPALSMCFEPPESGLLSRPPRNIRKDRLANFRLLLHAYGFLGVLESLCAMSMFVLPLSSSLTLCLTMSCTQVILVSPGQRRALLITRGKVRQLSRRPDAGPTLRSPERVLFYARRHAVGVSGHVSHKDGTI